MSETAGDEGEVLAEEEADEDEDADADASS